MTDGHDCRESEDDFGSPQRGVCRGNCPEALGYAVGVAAMRGERDQALRERDEAIKAAGAPTWQCRNCGSLGPFQTVTHGALFDPPDYDLECPECQSTDVAESPTEAFRAQSDRADVAEELVVVLADAADQVHRDLAVIQPYLGIWKKHGAAIEEIRAAAAAAQPQDSSK